MYILRTEGVIEEFFYGTSNLYLVLKNGSKYTWLEKSRYSANFIFDCSNFITHKEKQIKLASLCLLKWSG